MLIVWEHFLTGKAKLCLKWRPVKDSEITGIVFCGFPEMIAQFATPVMTICMNQMLGRHVGENGIDDCVIGREKSRPFLHFCCNSVALLRGTWQRNPLMLTEHPYRFSKRKTAL